MRGAAAMTRVYVVMSELAIEDDGDRDVCLISVHESQDGAARHLAPAPEEPPDGSKGGTRNRWIAEMVLLP